MRPSQLQSVVPLVSVILAVGFVAELGPAGHTQAAPAGALKVVLEPSLEGRRAFFTGEIESAVRTAVAAFARLGLARDPREVLETAYVFASVGAAREKVAAHFGVSPERVPETFFGTIDGKVLFVVTPELYEGIYRKLYPDQPWSPAEYRKAIVHESLHRVHAIVAAERFGTEEGMGPRWFFEGLALHLAGQFEPRSPETPMAWPEIARAIAQDTADALPSPTYPTYARMVRSLEPAVPLRWMIEHAGDADFVGRIEQQIKK